MFDDRGIPNELSPGFEVSAWTPRCGGRARPGTAARETGDSRRFAAPMTEWWAEDAQELRAALPCDPGAIFMIDLLNGQYFLLDGRPAWSTGCRRGGLDSGADASTRWRRSGRGQ
ncbi:hypothetical protein ACGF0J_09380 [Nonomuraea sp. NPDC047897]|uniref:hypothetical protein n=1 Tax=Nonomuraea sp. NPDC047897 TaxID=3364346 RepID=UPI003712FBCB